MIGQAPPSGVVRRSVVSLFVANSISFATLGLSYLLYSRLLNPAQFGLYSTALVIGTFGQLILDGGLNTMIKAPEPPDRDQQGTVDAADWPGSRPTAAASRRRCPPADPAHLVRHVRAAILDDLADHVRRGKRSRCGPR